MSLLQKKSAKHLFLYTPRQDLLFCFSIHLEDRVKLAVLKDYFFFCNAKSVFKKYLKRELRIHEEILERLKEATGESAVKRKKEIEEERQLILAALNHYES